MNLWQDFDSQTSEIQTTLSFQLVLIASFARTRGSRIAKCLQNLSVNINYRRALTFEKNWNYAKDGKVGLFIKYSEKGEEKSENFTGMSLLHKAILNDFNREKHQQKSSLAGREWKAFTMKPEVVQKSTAKNQQDRPEPTIQLVSQRSS